MVRAGVWQWLDPLNRIGLAQHVCEDSNVLITEYYISSPVLLDCHVHCYSKTELYLPSWVLVMREKQSISVDNTM